MLYNTFASTDRDEPTFGILKSSLHFSITTLLISDRKIWRPLLTWLYYFCKHILVIKIFVCNRTCWLKNSNTNQKCSQCTQLVIKDKGPAGVKCNVFFTWPQKFLDSNRHTQSSLYNKSLKRKILKNKQNDFLPKIHNPNISHLYFFTIY